MTAVTIQAGPYEARQCPVCDEWIHAAGGPFAEDDPTKPLTDLIHFETAHHDLLEERRRAGELGIPYFPVNEQPVAAVRALHRAGLVLADSPTPYAGPAAAVASAVSTAVVREYGDIVHRNGTELAVARCMEGLYGVAGEVLELAETDLGLPHHVVDALAEDLAAGFASYQRRLKLKLGLLGPDAQCRLCRAIFITTTADLEPVHVVDEDGLICGGRADYIDRSG